jgi:hypothetical protein
MTYQELLGQIKKIQIDLWKSKPFGNVSILVGAGFSKNAIPSEGSSQSYPDWSELAQSLLDSLYPGENEDQRQRKIIKSEVPAYILRLAQEYIELYSQKDLNVLIEDSIPDSQYIPGKVHDELLKLPFKDVFTTNYDTLLERASYKNYEREYKIITTKEQLSGSVSPRIIKLHGSFPNVTPYVISEEHYRRYPIDNKPFVNTVIQSLIENTLILIGFSGEDPNFLNWIGWIRDELPGMYQKVYICTIPQKDEFNEAQKRLLLKRGIELLDLNLAIEENSILKKSSNTYQDTLLWFFSKLGEGERKESPTKWPYHTAPLHNLPKNLKSEHIKLKIIDELEMMRKTFPGWNIVPASNRFVLNSYFLSTIESRFEDLLTILDSKESGIDLIDVFFWAKRKTLESINFKTSNLIRKYIEEIIKDKKTSLSKESKPKFINILIYLYVDARENFELDNMEFYVDRIKETKDLSNSHLDWFKREESIYILKTGNLKKLREYLSGWDLSEKVLSIELLFKASFLIEIGSDEEAKRMLYQTLTLIRNRTEKDIEKKSLEGLCIYLLQRIEKNVIDNGKTDIKDFDDRMLQLEYDQCNPQTHIRDLRSTIVEKKRKNKEGSIRVKKFDPFAYSYSESLSSGINFSDENKLVNFFDYSPIPLRSKLYIAVNEDVIIRLVNNILSFQPLNVIPLLIRFRSKSAFDNVINRVSIFGITDENFSLLEKVYFPSFFEMIDLIIASGGENTNKADIMMADSLLKLISFMIPRLKSDSLNQIMQRVLKIFQGPIVYQRQLSENANIIVKRICSQKSFFCRENLSTINKYFNLPLPSEEVLSDPRIEYPYIHVDYIQFLDGLREDIDIDDSYLNHMIVTSEKTTSVSDLALRRIVILLEYRLIDEKYFKIVSSNFWDSMDNNTPSLKGLRSWVPFKYLTEAQSNLSEKAKDEYKKKIKEIDFKQLFIPATAIGGPSTIETLINELMDIGDWYGNEFNISKLKWESDEASSILDSVFHAWDQVKEEHLKKNIGYNRLGISSQRKVYSDLFHFLNVCIIPSIEKVVLDEKKCVEMYQLLASSKIYIPEILIWTIEYNYDALFSSFNSTLKREQDSVIKAIVDTIGTENCIRGYIKEYIDEIIRIIQNRRQPGLFKSLDMVKFLYSKKSDLFSSEMIDKILFGLTRIEQETQFPKDLIYICENPTNGIPPIEFSDYRTLIALFVKEFKYYNKLNSNQSAQVEHLYHILLEDRFPEVKLPLEMMVVE